MKKLKLPGITILPFLLIAASSPPTDSTSTVFGLLFVKDNNCANQIITELYPVCKVLNGKWEEVSVEADSGDCCPDFILRRVKNFSIFEDGTVIGRFKVSEIEIGGFDCSGILVGAGTTDISNTTLRAKPGDQYEDISELRSGAILSYKQKRFPALYTASRAIGTQKLAQPHNKILTKNQENELIELAKRKYEENKDQVKFLDSIKIEISKTYDLDGDGTIEQLFVTSARVEHTVKGKCESGDTSWREENELRLTLWAQLVDNHFKLISYLVDKNSSDSWQEDYEFIDLIDIDSDSIPELIMQSYGYEYRSFQVYRFHNGKFELVFEGAGYGC
ncbi:MAG TPA: hypothetical protein VI546_05325 [candidate division Zixibacteria bacterium]|nr:hypothetical protein [candidate division Zixibacteria bacterium]